MDEHPHAEFFRALADGEIHSFEARPTDRGGCFHPAAAYAGAIAVHPDEWVVRRKPRMVKIGDVEVQAGITEAPLHGTSIWIADSTVDAYAWECLWNDHSDGKMRIQRGLVHLSEEPAVAMGRALAALTEVKR